MKTYILKLGAVFLAAFLLMFSAGCVDTCLGVSTEPDSLKVITPEEIESIFAAISNEVTDKYPTETDANGSEIVFWLEGGAVWHVSRACSTIKKAESSKVKSGSAEDALQSGKERPCRICGENAEYTESAETNTGVVTIYNNSEVVSEYETEKYPKEYGEDGEIVVFWLDGGKVWHESRYCSSLSRSDPAKLIYGSVAEALAAGKERACKNCSN